MESFEWIIDQKKTFPPNGTVQVPVGVTLLDIARSCSLRIGFDKTSGYLGRKTAEARIGTAFHQTLEHLINNKIDGNTATVNAAIKAHFNDKLKGLELRAKGNPREKTLPTNPQRVHLALSALLSIYPMLPARNRILASSKEAVGKYDLFRAGSVAVEVEVKSSNGIIKGFIDRAEKRLQGIHLIDYKSALRDDLPLRYEQQLKLYAALWFETFGEWPVSGEVFYPLTKKSHVVSLDEKECTALLEEATALVERLQKSQLEAMPGIVCQVCEYRPWCQPFWKYLEDTPSFTQQLSNASFGFEGPVRRTIVQPPFQFLEISWHGRIVEINFEQDRFPHLACVREGDRLRFLDFQLQGSLVKPIAKLTNYSEIWVRT